MSERKKSFFQLDYITFEQNTLVLSELYSQSQQMRDTYSMCNTTSSDEVEK